MPANFANLNEAQPINQQHGLARGLRYWLLTTPFRAGGTTWRELTNRWTATLESSGATREASNRVGGIRQVTMTAFNQRVNTGTQIQSLAAADGTLALWVRPVGAFNNSARYAVFGQLNGGLQPEFAMQKYIDNKIYAGFAASGADHRVTFNASAGTWPQNTWVHYLLTWISGGITTLYVNGVAAGSNAGTTTVRTPSSNLKIGDFPANSGNYPPAGPVDDLVVWSRFFTAAEARQFYRESLAGYPSLLRRRELALRLPAAGAVFRYPQLERGVRGLNRGLCTGMRG